MSKTMNIGIDHGYYAIKTRHFSFPAGIAEYDPTRFAIQCLIHKQSPDIAAGVDCSLEQRRNVDGSSPSLQLGAGDQGVMVGYACSETPQMLPLLVVLAHRLTSALTIARKSGAIQGLPIQCKAERIPCLNVGAGKPESVGRAAG